MISLVAGVVIGMVMGKYTERVRILIPLFSMEIKLGLKRVLMAMMFSVTVILLLI